MALNQSHRELGTQRWKDQRLRVLKRDGYICQYCGQEATQVDHVIPRKVGGTHDLDNLVACCAPCNSAKGARSEGVFLGAGSTSTIKEYVDYKTYSLYLLDFNYQQHKCLLKLYGKESAWKPDAVNGSHYGIPQGRSQYLAKVDGYKQVVWGLSYIGNRYGEPCIALDHWSKYGWH